MNKIGVFIISLLLCFSLVAEAQAVPVTLTIDQILTEDNPYSVSPGETYQWDVEYDPSKILPDPDNPGHGILIPWVDPTLNVTALIGTYNFDDISEEWGWPLLPALTFTDGVLDGFFMFTVLDYGVDGNGQPVVEYISQMGGDQYQLRDSHENLLSAGHFTFPAAPVPEPATMILLGSGLAGLAGLRKRFKKS